MAEKQCALWEDELKDLQAQVAGIRAWIKNDVNVEEIQKRVNILEYLLGKLERNLTPRAPDAPKSAPVCTCSMDDGIHEWNCALEKARR